MYFNNYVNFNAVDVMLKLQQRVTQLETQLAENIRQHNQEVQFLVLHGVNSSLCINPHLTKL